ncbi:AKR_collapsed_G0006380.mRNA.1.CDS.1 [Saccharomyces cerevisiae]|nr:AKR_collapsed_G0006380.mRNA.1.CDS.1 [Saccharomyces cerevisiae]
MRFSHFLKFNAVPEWQNHYLDYNELKNLIYTLQTDELKQETPTGDLNDDADSQTPGPIADIESNIAAGEPSSSKRRFTHKLKRKLFGSKTPSGSKRGDSDEKAIDGNNINEETIELDELSPQGKTTSFNKNFIRKKFFESRSSSVSSEGKTLFSSYDTFVTNLSDEKLKVDDFYKRMEAKFYERFDHLINDLEKEGIVTRLNETFNPEIQALPPLREIISGTSETHSSNNPFEIHSSNIDSELRNRFDYSEEEMDEDDDVDVFADTTDNTALLNYSQFNIKSQKKSLLKQTIINLYIDLCQLKSFIELNRMGFSKITKKSDKVLHMNTRQELIESEEFFKDTYIFQHETLSTLNSKIAQLIEFYAVLMGQPGNVDSCKQELKSYLHDHIVWERSNTWKDMLVKPFPLHITGLLVPLLTVLFRVLKDDDGKVMGAAAASTEILGTMWSSTIMILLAGFTLGEALSQYNVAKVLASWLLALAGTKPRNVLLMAMSVVFFLSMWISNVASPVLTYSLLTPLLDPLDYTSPFAKALVMGVALSADIGGMASPISSPQNIISMQYLKPYGIGWGQFFAVALPTGILSMLCSWALMILTFKIGKTKLEKFKPIRTRFTIKQYFIIIVTIATILLWCVESQIESAFGSSGEIAVIPIVLFFGTGLLSTKDFNTFPWSIVVLAMGGIALGKAVSSSGLLVTIARALQKKIQNDGVFAILCIFGILMLVVGTFVSHTVSAIIIIPLVQEVGDKLSDPKAAPILVFGCALLASCGMGLASSGFPNVTAISMTDRKGNRWLTVGAFISRGVPASLLAFVCVITLGYGISSSVLKGST